MTRLIVSVRNVEEARIARRGGADLIDIKEPRRGALGASDPSVWRRVAREIGGRTPLSLALGDLSEYSAREPPFCREQLPRACYVKLGLAGCRGWPDWRRRWSEATSRLGEGVIPVAVAYADPAAAVSPGVAEVVKWAQRSGRRALLVDTYVKDGRGLFDHLPVREVERLIESARAARMLVVLAGALKMDSLRTAAQLGPDYVAVRGAVCRGDRTDAIDASMVESVKTLLGPWPGPVGDAA